MRIRGLSIPAACLVVGVGSVVVAQPTAGGPAPTPPALQPDAPATQPAAAPDASGAPVAAPPTPQQPAAGPEAPAAPGQPAPQAQPTTGDAGPYGPPPSASGRWTRSAEPPPPGNPYPTYRQPRRRWSREDAERLRLMLEAQRARRAAGLRERRALEDPYGGAPGPVVPRVRGDAGAAFTLGLSVDAIFHDDVGFRRFDHSKTNARFGAFAGYDLLSLRPNLILSGELGVGVESLTGDAQLGGIERAELLTWTFFGGLNLRWDACAFFAPQLRVSAGASVGELTLRLDQSKVDDSAGSGFGALGAGFLLHTPARLFETPGGKLASLKLGLLFEVGYALRSSMEFALPSRHDANSIEVVNAKLGRLDLSGPYIRTALITRF